MPNSFTRWLSENWHRILVHAAALFPLVWLAFDYLSDPESYTFTRTLMLRTGSAGLILLVASLACTPLSWMLRWPRLVQVRRTFGLYAFLHASLHLCAYAIWENALDFELMWRDLGERRAMTIGLAAFLMLIPLALTSTQGWQRRLGRRWKTVHRLVYIAGPLSILHFFLLDRDIVTVPLIYTAVVGVLLALRLPWRRWIFRRHATSHPLE